MERKETEMSCRRIFAVLMAGLLVAGSAVARGKKINRSELPAAVEQALQLHSPGATIKHLSLENNHGQIYYEAKMKVNGHSKEVLINPNGEVLMVKEQVPVSSLPPEVKAGLKAKAGFLGPVGRIDKVETITREGRLEGYEARVDTPVPFVSGMSSASHIVRVDPHGN
jgi:hypothetical protein